jgi:hypothetical protein
MFAIFELFGVDLVLLDFVKMENVGEERGSPLLRSEI